MLMSGDKMPAELQDWGREVGRSIGIKAGFAAHDAAWREEDHPRGQPENAGEFTSGSGGGKGKGGEAKGSEGRGFSVPKGSLFEKFLSGGGEGGEGGERLSGNEPASKFSSHATSIWDDISDDVWKDDPSRLTKSPKGFTVDLDRLWKAEDPGKAPRNVIIRAPDGDWYVNGERVPVVKTVHEALDLLGKGKGVMFERPEKAVALVTHLKGIVDAARKAGKDAPKINLCQIYVAGANLFCDRNMDIARAEMPQLGGIPKPGSEASKLPIGKYGGVDITELWVKELRDRGVEVEETTLDASLMRSSQNQLDGAKVGAIAAGYYKDGLPKDEQRLVVSDDNYIVDGHHR